MRAIISLILLVIALPALACRAGDALIGETIRGSGRMVDDMRPVSGISRVELATTGTLHIELGNREELRQPSLLRATDKLSHD